jgi:hypothetical protein
MNVSPKRQPGERTTAEDKYKKPTFVFLLYLCGHSSFKIETIS